MLGILGWHLDALRLHVVLHQPPRSRDHHPTPLKGITAMTNYCPHCGFPGTQEEVDDHRATGVHNDQPQAGSNLPNRPRS